MDSLLWRCHGNNILCVIKCIWLDAAGGWNNGKSTIFVYLIHALKPKLEALTSINVRWGACLFYVYTSPSYGLALNHLVLATLALSYLKPWLWFRAFRKCKWVIPTGVWQMTFWPGFYKGWMVLSNGFTIQWMSTRETNCV